MASSEVTLPLGGYRGVSWMVPCEYTYLSSPFGYRYHPTTGQWTMHKGIDLAAPLHTPIYSTKSGTISGVYRKHETAGNYVCVEHEVTETITEGNNVTVKYTSRYLHMNSFADIFVGQKVEQGTLLGYVGSTGRSTGPHLHLGLRRNGEEVDPAIYIFGKEDVNKESVNVGSTVNFWEHQEKESIKHNDWKPMYSSKTTPTFTFEGTSEGLFTRRQPIVRDYSCTLFDGKHINDLVCGGVSDMGLNVTSINTSNTYTTNAKSTLPHISKDQVVAQYYSKSSGYRIGELPNNIKNNDSGAWLVVGAYIANYLYSKGWTSEKAICALLGNMGAECGMNPARWQKRKPYWENSSAGKYGFGLIQWTPAIDYFDSSQLKDISKFGGPYDIDTQLDKIIDEFTNGGVYFFKKGDSLNSYLNSIKNSSESDWEEWNCTTNSRTNIINYLTNNKSSGIAVSGASFGKNSDLSIELLTVAYALNRERPSATYWAPQKRVGYAQTFYRLLFGGDGTIEDVYMSTNPTNPPCSDPMSCDDLWKSKHKSENNLNPYPVVSGNECVLPSNNAYCWGIAYGNNTTSENSILLADNYSTDWFDYNKDNNIYDYGMTPRVGSVACWTYRNYDSKKVNHEKSCVGYVTDVLGSEVLKISWIKHNTAGYTSKDNINQSHNGSEDENRVITNYNNNWGLDTNEYKFRGFIYLKQITDVCKNITVEDNKYCVQAHSAAAPYTSMTFAIHDVKHYNKLRLIYDVEIYPPDDGSEKLTFDIYDYCNRYIIFTQQILNTDQLLNGFSWNSKLPKFTNKVTIVDGKKQEEQQLFLANPFPKGHLLVSSSINRSSRFGIKHIDDKDMYYITDLDETYNIHEYVEKNKRLSLYHQDIVNPQDSEHKETQYFDREFPSYITIVPMALPLNKDGKEYHGNIMVRIKKIMLYR